jgi:uncharacterized protein
MPPPSFSLTLLPGDYAVCRLDPAAPIPSWADGAGFRTISRTADELSIVCPAGDVPAGVRCETPWRCVKVNGPFPFDAPGVLASLVVPLAAHTIPVLAIATFDTDYLLLPGAHADAALRVLHAAGHSLR